MSDADDLCGENVSFCVVSTDAFDCYLLPGRLALAHAQPQDIPSYAWLFMRDIVRNSANASSSTPILSGLASYILDEQGLSMIVPEQYLCVLEQLDVSGGLRTCADKWIAFNIHVTATAAEFPGAVYHLANLMASHGISILHLSTFGSEAFLVQTEDSQRAIDVLRTLEDPLALQDLMDTVKRATGKENISHPNSEGKYCSDEICKTVERFRNQREYNAGESTPGLRLLPNPLVLVKLNTAFWKTCQREVAELLFYDCRFSLHERLLQQAQNSDSSRSIKAPTSGLVHNGVASDSTTSLSKASLSSPNAPTKGSAPFLLGFWVADEEITMLLKPEDVARFPEGSLVVCPGLWYPIKLCGRPIAFHETGVVSAMCQVDSDVPILNVSTFLTNVTLVQEDHLGTTLSTLSSAMNILSLPHA